MNKNIIKKYLIYSGKVFVSGILAFIVLTLFCVLYYNLPVHNETKDGSTDYAWEPNAFYSRATEGFAFGKTNNEGYVNEYDYNKKLKIDILLMGSSHMEAHQVQQNESTSGVLNRKFDNYRTYNIGISAHTFITCFSNLENALNKYKPTKYVIIETSTTNFSDKDLKDALNNSIKEIPSYTSGIVGLLQKNQFLRLLDNQIRLFNSGEDAIIPKVDVNIKNKEKNNELVNQLLDNINQITSKHKVKAIILYHPSTILNRDGSLTLSSEKENIDNFSKLCKENNIYFLDMSERFKMEYKKNHILPYGFYNTSVGSGHLNKYGHKMVAEELYNFIKEVK